MPAELQSRLSFLRTSLYVDWPDVTVIAHAVSGAPSVQWISSDGGVHWDVFYD